MFKSTVFLSRHSNIKAGLIFALIIIAAYSPVVIFGHTYAGSTPFPPKLLGLEGNFTPFAYTIDPAADYENTWPLTKLTTELFTQGTIPLWDPYLAIGIPLAADTDSFTFSPLILGFFLPTNLWDIPLLISLWIAGIFTYLFLRNIGLNFISSISGGVFYMLSGAFTWYLPHVDIAVKVFTPFILYSLEKIIQNRNPKYIILSSIAFAFGILGAHLESLVLQLSLVAIYFSFRVVSLTIYHRKQKNLNQSLQPLGNIRRILLWSILAFVGGLGLSAFFILPVYEFLENGSVSHDIVSGLGYNMPYVLLTNFIPYVMGLMHTTWSSDLKVFQSWNSLPGYVGIFSLFFSILGVYLSLKKTEQNIHKYTPLFFVSVAIFFMLKTIGVPLVNWIGYLPIFNLISFPRYLSVIIPFSFAVAAAFGVDLIGKTNLTKKSLGLTFIMTISIIILLLIPYDFYIYSGFSNNYGLLWVIANLLLSSLFALSAFFLSLAISKNKFAIVGVVPLILLELSLYVPLGLSPMWMAYKSIILLCGMASITLLVLRPNKLSWNLAEPKYIKLYTIICVLIITYSGVTLVAEFSPYVLAHRYDSFPQNPITYFLKENLGYSRIFSFDYSLGPNYPAAYQISTVGIMTSYNVNSFYSFNHNFLDQNAWLTTLGYNPWEYTYGTTGSLIKFSDNEKYFDFLGVKYLTSSNVKMDKFLAGPPGADGNAPIMPNDKSIIQQFISPFNSIDSVNVQLGTYGQKNQGLVILTLDSVPYYQAYHRESTVNAQNIVDGQFQIFQFEPLIGVKGKLLVLNLKFIPSTPKSSIAAFFYNGHQSPPSLDEIRNFVRGPLSINGFNSDGILAFAVNSNEFKPIFQFQNFTVYENLNAFPRAYLVNHYQKADSYTSAQNVIKDPNFDLRNNVVLEGTLSDEQANLLSQSTLDSDSYAQITSYSANKVEIQTHSNSASLLVLTDTYYPGWHADMDGKETTIYRADGIVRAIFVPSGEHTVEFSYMPQSFVLGVTISLTTAGILIGLFVYSKRKEQINEHIQLP